MRRRFSTAFRSTIPIFALCPRCQSWIQTSTVSLGTTSRAMNPARSGFEEAPEVNAQIKDQFGDLVEKARESALMDGEATKHACFDDST